MPSALKNCLTLEVCKLHNIGDILNTQGAKRFSVWENSLLGQ